MSAMAVFRALMVVLMQQACTGRATQWQTLNTAVSDKLPIPAKSECHSLCQRQHLPLYLLQQTAANTPMSLFSPYQLPNISASDDTRYGSSSV
jgi:hypothetical protein